MPRLAFAHLPFWPTERIGKNGPPFALVEEGRKGLEIAAVNGSARALGLRPREPLADARARCEALEVGRADPGGDWRCLKRLALNLNALCPAIAPRRDLNHDFGHDFGHDLGLIQYGLAFEISGLAHLFGGEDGFLDRLQAQFARRGISARLAIADALGGAIALARFGRRDPAANRFPRPHGPRALEAALKPLPIAALRLEGELAADLRMLGLRRIGDLLAQDRAALARRFGRGLGLRLDQAMGLIGEPVKFLSAPPEFEASSLLPAPMTGPLGALEAGLEGVCIRLSKRLKAHARLAARLDLRILGPSARCVIGVRLAAASDDPLLFARLIRMRVEAGLAAGLLGRSEEAEMERLSLAAGRTFPACARQSDWTRGPGGEAAFDPEAGDLESGLGLIDRLRARLGPDRAVQALAQAQWAPERAEIWSPDPAPASTPSDWGLPCGRARPLMLLHPPEPVTVLYETPDGPPRLFRWRKRTHKIVCAAGPERLAPDWRFSLQAADRPARDYYRVETQAGLRLWLYRAGLGETAEWFAHGLGFGSGAWSLSAAGGAAGGDGGDYWGAEAFS